MPILTQQQLAKLKKIVQDASNALAISSFGYKIDAADMQRLVDEGWVDPQLIDSLAEDAYKIGVQMAEDATVGESTLQEAKRQFAAAPVALSEIERRAMGIAQSRAGEYVVGLGNRWSSTLGRIVIDADQQLAQETRQAIKDKTSQAIAERQTYHQLASDLRGMTEDWGRDWDRIAATELQTAHQEGFFEATIERHGGDEQMARVPDPGACPVCLRLLTDSEGKPIVRPMDWWLENGSSNAGRKQADWKPVYGPIHPFCRCQSIHVPEGMEIQEDGSLEVIEKSTAEDDWKKSKDKDIAPDGISARDWDKKRRKESRAAADKVRTLKNGAMLYHLTPEINFKRIKRHGLRPRTSRWGEGRRRSYSNRIYFTTTPESSREMLDVLKNEDVVLASKKHGDTYILVTVDPSKIHKMKAMVDPEEPRFSVYITTRVRPSAIVDIKKGKLEDLFVETGSGLKKSKDAIPGGLAAGKPDSDFDAGQLAAGIKVEMEHTTSKRIAKEIAKDHLTEDPNYYKKLKTIEKSDLKKAEPGDKEYVPSALEGQQGGKLPKLKWRGLTIRLEHEEGDIRAWFDPNANRSGYSLMNAPYGYIEKTNGVDGDEVDVFMGPVPSAPYVFVIHQRKAPDFKKYDEDKCMIGFESRTLAIKAYLANYDDPRFLGSVTAMKAEAFVKKVKKTKAAATMIKALPTLVWCAPDDDLVKAEGHKYTKRVPTGKAKPKYRYFYSSPKTKKITSSADIVVGSKFKAAHGGKVGHFEVVGHDPKKGIVSVRHDESGRTAHIKESDLHRLVESFHRKKTVEAKATVEPVTKLPRATMADLGSGTWGNIEGFAVTAEELEAQATATPRKQFAIIKQPNGFVLVSKTEDTGKPKRTIRGDKTAVKMRATKGIDTVRASYVLVEASDLIASHKPTGTFAKHPGYPEGVQERRYHEVQAEQDKVDRIAKHLDPAILVNSNPDGVNGAPIVTDKNIVLGGNGRSMAMQRAYAEYPESARALKDYMTANAKAFGFKSADVAAMDQPVLVRKMRAKDVGDKEKQKLLGRRMNEALTQGLDPRSEEVAIGQFVTRNVTDTLVADIEQDQTVGDFLTSAKSADFVRSLRRAGIVDEVNKAKYLDKDTGLLNEDGRLRVERVLVAKFIPDASILDRMSPTLRQVLAKSTPALLASQEAGWDLSQALQKAVKADLFIKRQYPNQSAKKALGAFLAQPELAGIGASLHKEISSDIVAGHLLSVIREHLGKEKTPRALRGFALRAKQAEHASGGFAFASEGVVTSPAEAIDIEFGLTPQRSAEKQDRDKMAREKAKAEKQAQSEASRVAKIQEAANKQQGGLFGGGVEDMAASIRVFDLSKSSGASLLGRVSVHVDELVSAALRKHPAEIAKKKIISEVLDDAYWAVLTDPAMAESLKRMLTPLNSAMVSDLIDAHLTMRTSQKAAGKMSKATGTAYSGPATVGTVVSGAAKVDGMKSAARHVIDATAIMEMIEETIRNNKRKSKLAIDRARYHALAETLFETLTPTHDRPRQMGDWVLPFPNAHPDLEDNRRQTVQQGERAIEGQKAVRKVMRFKQVNR